MPLRLTSILNWAPAPTLCVQVMACTVPIVQMTAVLGEVTVTLAGDQRERAAHAVAVKPFADTRTIAVVLAAPVAVQA